MTQLLHTLLHTLTIGLHWDSGHQTESNKRARSEQVFTNLPGDGWLLLTFRSPIVPQLFPKSLPTLPSLFPSLPRLIQTFYQIFPAFPDSARPKGRGVQCGRKPALQLLITHYSLLIFTLLSTTVN